MIRRLSRVVVGFSALTAASTQSWECYGPSGKAGTTQTSLVHSRDASLRVLLKLPVTNTAGAAVPGPG